MAADPFELRRLYKHVRVVDVCDALDGIGYFQYGRMDPAIRPLWPGMRFWGVAFTVRCVPARWPMWKLDTTEEIVDAHGVWFRQVGGAPDYGDQIRPGHVIVTDTGGARDEVGYWGSANSMNMTARGAVGIVTNGCVRDTGEVAIQKTPICAARRGRTIIPGRIETVEWQSVIGCGGVQVAPGDLVGADDDGVVVVPVERAEEVARHARAVLLADMRGRRKLYDKHGLPPDETVDFEAVEAYYASLE